MAPWSFTYLHECVQAVFLMSLVMRTFHCVERFHMTSWRPMILVFRNIETTPIPQLLLFETNLVKAFFCSINLHIDAGHVSENALYILLNEANVQANIVIIFILTKPSDPKCIDSLFNFPICFNCSSRARLHHENPFLFTVTVIEIFVTFIWTNKENLSATEKFFKRFIMFKCHISFYINIYISHPQM